jgi:hypothetical protein
MENEKKEYRYIQFPLCLIQETYKDRDHGLRLIMSFGIVKYAFHQQFTLEDAAGQLLYDYVCNREVLQTNIAMKLSEAEDSGNLHFDGWSSDFFPKRGTNYFEDTLGETLQLLEDDTQLRVEAILNYQLHLATSENNLRIKMASNDRIINGFKEASKIKQEFEKKFGPDTMPCCKINMLLHFLNEKQADLDSFRAYIGIKSMLGRRSYISTNKPAILSRMVGCKSKAAFEYYTTNKYNKNKTLLPTVEKYSKRYHMDKLLATLVQRKYIMYYPRPNISVIYMSKYMEPEALVSLVRETKDKQDIKKRIRDAEARLDLEQRMNNNEQA